MSIDVESRVSEILDLYSSPRSDVAWLLCDRHEPERTALTVVDMDSTATHVTYGELAESSRRFAAVLSAEGVQPGDRIATLMGKSVDLVGVLLGIWRVGAVYVPLFTAFAEEAVRSRLSGAEAVLVIADEDHLSKVPEGPWQVIVSGSQRPDGVQARMNSVELPSSVLDGSVAVGSDGPLVHMFTSGTTGAPKGVVHAVQYVAGWHSYLEFALGASEDSVFWCGADPGWAYGLYTAIIAPLAAGVRTILLRGGFSAATTWEVLSELQVTDFAAAPTVFRGLRAADVPVPEGLALQRLSSAGEPLTPEVNEWANAVLGVQVNDHYGQTELGMPIGYPHHPQLQIPLTPGAMGVALPGWEITALSEGEDTQAAVGEIGRLAVVVSGSPFMTFTGYSGSTAGADRFRCDGRYFLTGDTASIDQDRVIRFSARDDDVIIMAGYRIGPFDVESTLLQHAAVIECAVIAAPDAVRGEVVEAFVVLASGITATVDLVHELQQWVKDNYAAHAYPRRIHIADTLPKTPSGKIQRAELRRQRREIGIEAS